jgi:hypothetical protein
VAAQEKDAVISPKIPDAEPVNYTNAVTHVTAASHVPTFRSQEVKEYPHCEEVDICWAYENIHS